MSPRSIRRRISCIMTSLARPLTKVTYRNPGKVSSYSRLSALNRAASSSACVPLPEFKFACSRRLNWLIFASATGLDSPRRGCDPKILFRKSPLSGELEVDSADKRLPTSSISPSYELKLWFVSAALISDWSSGDGSNRVSSNWSRFSTGRPASDAIGPGGRAGLDMASSRFANSGMIELILPSRLCSHCKIEENSSGRGTI